MLKEQVGAGILKGIGEELKHRNETPPDGVKVCLIIIYGELVGGEAEHLETDHMTLLTPGFKMRTTLKSVSSEIRQMAES